MYNTRGYRDTVPSIIQDINKCTGRQQELFNFYDMCLSVPDVYLFILFLV